MDNYFSSSHSSTEDTDFEIKNFKSKIDLHDPSLDVKRKTSEDVDGIKVDTCFPNHDWKFYRKTMMMCRKCNTKRDATPQEIKERENFVQKSD